MSTIIVIMEVKMESRNEHYESHLRVLGHASNTRFMIPPPKVGRIVVRVRKTSQIP